MSALAEAVRDHIYGENDVSLKGIGGFQSGVDPQRALENLQLLDYINENYGNCNFDVTARTNAKESFSLFQMWVRMKRLCIHCWI